MKYVLSILLCLSVLKIQGQWRVSPTLSGSFYQVRFIKGSTVQFSEKKANRDRGFPSLGVYTEYQLNHLYRIDAFFQFSRKLGWDQYPYVAPSFVVKHPSGWGANYIQFSYTGIRLGLNRSLSPRITLGAGLSYHFLHNFGKPSRFFADIPYPVRTKQQIGIYSKAAFRYKRWQLILTYDQGLAFLGEPKNERLFYPLGTFSVGVARSIQKQED